MDYKHGYIVDTDGYQVEFVLVLNGEIQHYELKTGESLVDMPIEANLLKPRWNGSEWVEGATDDEIQATLPSLDELKAAKKAEIASARYNAEIGGITYNGVTIATDRESQGLINGAVTQTLLTPSYSLQWKTSAGAIKLTSSKIQELGTAVREHVQACFDKEFELTAIIDACETVEEVAAVVWPE